MAKGDRRVAAIRKLSDSFKAASLAVTSVKLKALMDFIGESKQVVDELAHLAADLKRTAAPDGEPFIFTNVLAENESLVRAVFKDCDDARFRNFKAGGKPALMVYLYGMTDETLLEKNVLETLMSPTSQQKVTIDPGSLVNQLLTSAVLRISASPSEAIQEVMRGSALVMIDGIAEVFLVGAARQVKRGIEDAKTETVIRGPHDAFTETLGDNISLLRRRARDSDIKVRVFQLGERTKTSVALVYAASLVKPGLVAELERRLSNIKTDQMILSAHLEEFIIDHPWSPFPQTHMTERPDTFIVSLYEGRAGLIVDNTPFAIIVPCTVTAMLQSVEDFTVQPIIASLIRFTRYVSFWAGILLPGIYIAIVSYNPGMLPTTLAVSVAELRARTPYPAFLEVIILEAIMELFQEAVVRLPVKIAPAAGIVGGFVIGTTIVQAGLVNALLVVAIAGTAIASYTIPSYNLALAIRWLRLPVIFLATVLGFYGVVIGYLAIVVHMNSLRSFGESYLGGLFDITLLEDTKDTLMRLPMIFMGARPKVFGPQDRKRVDKENG